MVSADVKRKIKDRMRWELVLKSTTAAPTIATLAAGIGYLQLYISEHAEILSLMMYLCALNATIRYFIGRLGIQGKLDREKTLRYTLPSLYVNTALWTLSMWLIFMQTEVGSKTFVLAFMASISLMVTSVLTMSFKPLLAICFQVGMISGNIYVFFHQFSKSNDHAFLWMGMSMILLTFHYYRQTRGFYSQMFEKYRYEVELEISLVQLQASNKKVLEETSRAETSARLASLGQMAGGIAHEVNNPLAIATGLLEQISIKLNQPDFSKQDVLERISRASNAVNRITLIIRSLLYVARSDEGNTMFDNTKVENLLVDVLNISRERFHTSGIKLEVVDVPDVTVRTKQILIAQVLLNLLNNAFDEVIQHEGADKYLKIYFKLDKSKVTVCIENSGPKIPPNIQSKVFEPFFTTKDVGKGTGLGLSICKGIMESMSEKIWLEKDLPHTTFCFTLSRSQT